MKLFKRSNTPSDAAGNQSAMAEMALRVIHDGVIIIDKNGVVQFINPAAATMTGYNSINQALGLDYGLVVRLESKEGRPLSETENPLIQAVQAGQPLEGFQGSLIVGQSDKRIPVTISVLPPEGMSQNRIITFRNIAKELKEEGEQAEFISTASHEMRTPVATIDGYISLCLNPQTATIDERAKGYLDAAQKASKHLGKLFQDLLNVTKLDDSRVRPNLEPVEMTSAISAIVKDFLPRATELKINLTFGSEQSISFEGNKHINQVVYSAIDLNFIREIMDNLIDNALKYTPEGGSIYVNVRGDGDRALINVTDTGIGISSDDLVHIFQKFYRADNSDTREIGGTGLGLYLVKQRAEAMGGKVWAESAFGEGSTFYVSLPRLSADEYEKRMIAVRNRQMQEQLQRQAQAQQSAPAVQAQTTPIPQPVPTIPRPAPAIQAQPTPATQPASQPIPQPTPATQQPIPQPMPQPAPQSSVPNPVVAPQPIASTSPISPPPTQIQSSQSNNINVKGEIK